jgi:3D (Asp-Asp-Asp) domain-containing protein
VQGVTVAADISILPFGTKICIDGVGERVVQDTGSAIKGKKIDLYFENHQEAWNFGRQTKQVTILN